MTNKINKQVFDQYVAENTDIICKLIEAGVLTLKNDTVRNHNVGASDYHGKILQTWSSWYLKSMTNPWEADIQKRLDRQKAEPGKTMEQSRRMDYEKIKHICDELIRQIDVKESLYVKGSPIGGDLNIGGANLITK